MVSRLRFVALLRVNLTRYPYARARARGDVELGDETDRLEPAGRRCGCWATSPIPF